MTTYVPAYDGRVGEIMQQVRDLTNDATVLFASDDQLLRWINLCHKQIVTKGYFLKSDQLDLEVGLASYTLTDDFDDFVKFNVARWYDSDDLLHVYSTARLYRLALQWGTSAVFCDGTTLYVSPVPTEVKTLEIDYYFNPGEIDGTIVSDPYTPAEHDYLYVQWCMHLFKQRDAPHQQALMESSWWRKGFDTSLGVMMFAARMPPTSLRPVGRMSPDGSVNA